MAAKKDDDIPLSSKIDYILKEQDPSRESLCILLKLSTPTLTDSDVMDEASRNAAMSKLVHDVSANPEASTRLPNIQSYMDRCCENLEQKRATGKRKANPNSPPPSLVVFPEKFHVHNKWPFLNVYTIQPNGGEVHSNKGALAALHCINARGTIAHGQQVEAPFLWGEHFKDLSVKQVFEKIGGGVKRLESVEAIQQEIMDNGPVVSTMFCPLRAFPMANHPASLIPSHGVKETYPVLIVGWEIRGLVEMWLVKRLSDGTQNNDNKPVRVSFRSFGIDDEVVAPRDSFDNRCWQRGPHFDAVGLPDGWMESPQLTLRIHQSDRKVLVGENYRAMDLMPFCVRNRDRLAHSRRYTADGFHWMKEAGLWNLTLEQVKEEENTTA